jgi:hypothetical protein
MQADCLDGQPMLQGKVRTESQPTASLRNRGENCLWIHESGPDATDTGRLLRRLGVHTWIDRADRASRKVEERVGLKTTRRSC